MGGDAPRSLDVAACLRKGAVGALGSVPGTLCAHPCDVVKIRMQTATTAGAGAGSAFGWRAYRDAVVHVYRTGGAATVRPPVASGGGVVRGGGGGWALGGFYRGLVPALEQRVVARGPMFLCSEAYTQVVERWDRRLEGTTAARFVGSVGSGYTTGSLASLAEYRKKLLSQGIVTASEARWGAIVRSAVHSGNRTSLVRRMHAAGLCSAVYDSLFFGTQHHLHQTRDWSLPTSFAAAAATAVVGSFAFDTTVARMMVVRPSEAVKPFRKALVATLRGAGRGYGGVLARVAEFSISYFVTGSVAALGVYVGFAWES